MKVKGSMTSKKTIPDIRTNIEKTLPKSLVKVISPKPSVDITVRVQ
jgi:hypothetical protein